MYIRESNEVYDVIIKNIQDIELKLNKKSDDEVLNNAKQQVLHIIQQFRKEKIDKSIEELKINQEWDIFTIAFYGETNAGKSTIIESLRIYFQEEKKNKYQEKFKKYLFEFEEKLKKLNSHLLKEKTSLFSNKELNKKLINNFQIKKKNLEKEILLQEENLKKHNSSLFSRVFSFLTIITIQKKIKNFQIKVENLNKEIQVKIQEFEDKKNYYEKVILDIEKEIINNKEEYKKKLYSVQDGKIIGDGRPDFTRKAISYSFTKGNQNFSILDIPGIEGKERDVIDEISSALKKSHAVFYVTSSSTPPQKGDKNKKGTLEKIKDHLGSQTEVYTIFNKRITNPIQLDENLVSKSELESLKVLDIRIRESIGKNYSHTKSLSAKVSFLALADCLLENSKAYKEKNKFLSKFTKEELLTKTNFNDFTDFLVNDLVHNTKEKIIKSNYNKANKVLEEFIGLITKVSEEKFNYIYTEITEEVKDAKDNLNNTLRVIKSKIGNEVKKEIDIFKRSSRKEIYSYIEKDVKDEEVEKKLKNIFKENYNKLQKELENNLENNIEIFQNEIMNVIENFKRRVNIVLNDSKNLKIDSIDFDLDIDTDNGIDGWSIAGSLAGVGSLIAMAIGNSWNPIGWALFAMGVATVIIGAYKSIGKFFSTKYKMSEQRKSADENIEKNSKKISKNIHKQLKDSLSQLDNSTNNTIEVLESILQAINETLKYFDETKKSLKQLSRNIKQKGKL